MTGWTGKILYVDLTRGHCRRESIPSELLHAYLGGRGLGVRLMRDHFRLDPLDPETPLIFTVGPLCGTPSPGGARLACVSRSPLTGTIFSSCASGPFASRLKGAGLDAVFITGKSAEPVLLAIDGQRAELLPAGSLWGKGCLETFASLRKRGSVAAIGPAGENGVLFASIVLGEGDDLDRGGLGAVMGAKGLKAITVNGVDQTEIAEPERLERACADVMRLLRASPVLLGELGIAEYGTPALVDLIAQRRMVPTRNFSATSFPESINYSGPTIRNACGAVSDGCFLCPIQCKKRSRDGELLPEYDAASHFGALNGISGLKAIIKANSLCRELGMDSVSAASTIAAFGEERGRFPDAHELPKLLGEIAYRSGDGELLSLGSRRMAARLGRPELSMSVKSLELPAYDPRGAYGLALAYATSTRGGCHEAAFPISHEILRKPVPTDRFSFSGKARIIKLAEDMYAAVDSLAACRFAFLAATLEEYGELLSAVTGIEYGSGALMTMGERVYRTERFYNCENGFGGEDDNLPERFFSEPGSSGDGIEVPPIDRGRFQEELQKYYRIRKLTPEGRFAERSLPEGEP